MIMTSKSITTANLKPTHEGINNKKRNLKGLRYSIVSHSTLADSVKPKNPPQEE